MGTSGHMQHPFDIPNVKTGQDLINYFETIVEHLSTTPGSVKFDGINVSFKLVDDESTPTGKDFRMDRGTSAPESVIGMTAADAYKKWPEGHGMPPAIDELLKIFNEALPQIKPELKALGMWDDPTKYFNTEYMKKGKTNVIEYDEKILALHGVNQFYEKKAQPHRIKKGIGVDRPGMERPIDPETGKPTKHGSTEVSYDPNALQSIIEKVKPIAEQHEVSLVGDVATEISADVDFSETLNEPFTIQMTDTEGETHPLRDWLSQAINPFDAKVKKRDGKAAWAISKEIYFAVLDGVPLMEFLETPEDVKTAINGALFNHATHELGMDVKRASTSSKGGLESHEGIVIRGLDDRPVKVTGDFITKGAGGAIKDKIKASKEKETLAEGDVVKGPWNRNNDYEDALRARYEEEEMEARRNPKDPMTPEEHEEYMSLYDDDKKMVAIYPGRFQPMGRHHAEVYKTLLDDERFDDVYISTSDKVEMPESPFNFKEKQEIAAGHDIDPSKIVQTKNPYNAAEITNSLDPETVVVYFVGCKDMDADPNVCDGTKPRFPRESLGGMTKKGTPRYFRAFEGEEDFKGVKDHAYIAVAPHVEIQIPELGEMSGTTIRQALQTAEPEKFKSIMGFYDPLVYDMVKSKLKSTQEEELQEVSQLQLGIFLGLIEETLNEGFFKSKEEKVLDKVQKDFNLTLQSNWTKPPHQRKRWAWNPDVKRVRQWIELGATSTMINQIFTLMYYGELKLKNGINRIYYSVPSQTIKDPHHSNSIFTKIRVEKRMSAGKELWDARTDLLSKEPMAPIMFNREHAPRLARYISGAMVDIDAVNYYKSLGLKLKDIIEKDSPMGGKRLYPGQGTPDPVVSKQPGARIRRTSDELYKKELAKAKTWQEFVALNNYPPAVEIINDKFVESEKSKNARKDHLENVVHKALPLSMPLEVVKSGEFDSWIKGAGARYGGGLSLATPKGEKGALSVADRPGELSLAEKRKQLEEEEELEEHGLAGYAGPVGRPRRRKIKEQEVNEALNYLLQKLGV